MSDITRPDEFSLSFWMDGAENNKLGRAAYNWFSLLGRAAFWGVTSQDPLTCCAEALDLLAWQRCVTRYEGEPERLYRLRVKYAYANARDAGCVNGWKRIFQRLELTEDAKDLELWERMAGQDWDIVGIVLDDSKFTVPYLQDAIEIIIEDYGRTCRRYYFISRIVKPVYAGVNTFDLDHNTVTAAQSVSLSAAIVAGSGVFDHEQHTVEASLWALS